ncbi:hypothetical protein QTP88_018925 [Uroleucon formosanum]
MSHYDPSTLCTVSVVTALFRPTIGRILVFFRIDGGVGKDRVIVCRGASPQVYDVFSWWLFRLILVSNGQSNLILRALDSDLHQFYGDRCLVSPRRGREIIDAAAE